MSLVFGIPEQDREAGNKVKQRTAAYRDRDYDAVAPTTELFNDEAEALVSIRSPRTGL